MRDYIVDQLGCYPPPLLTCVTLLQMYIFSEIFPGALLPTWYSYPYSQCLILENEAESGQGRGPAVAAQIEITSMNTAM